MTPPQFQASPLQIRLLAESDLPFADSLRGLVGWNQTVRDWARFLSLSPDGCFLAEWQGEPAGTATTIRYEDAVAWIGMLLVHPDYRGRGIGRALLNHCLDFLRGRQVRCIKLDATPQGKLLYDKLGFVSQWPLTRWQVQALEEPSPEPGTRSNAFQQAPWTDLGSLRALDREVFGANRASLLDQLPADSRVSLQLRKGSEMLGYGLLREGTRARYLGPIVATTPEAGLELAIRLLRHAVGQSVFWDIPDENVPAVRLAERWGFTRQRPLLRMALGPDPHPGDPARCFGIVDPAAG